MGQHEFEHPEMPRWRPESWHYGVVEPGPNLTKIRSRGPARLQRVFLQKNGGLPVVALSNRVPVRDHRPLKRNKHNLWNPRLSKMCWLKSETRHLWHGRPRLLSEGSPRLPALGHKARESATASLRRDGTRSHSSVPDCLRPMTLCENLSPVKQQHSRSCRKTQTQTPLSTQQALYNP